MPILFSFLKVPPKWVRKLRNFIRYIKFALRLQTSFPTFTPNPSINFPSAVDENVSQHPNLNHTNKELGTTSNSTIQTSQIAPKPTTSQPEINTKENNLDFQPKNNKLHETSELDPKYAVTLSPIKNSCLTPVLPPKKKLGFPRFRSRSRNRNVSQLGDTSEADYSPQLITDVMHQRLLPKENCVTNIHYARRLPSPPIFRKKVSQEDSKNLFARDDQFVEKRGVEGSCFSPNRRYCNNPYEGMEGLHGEINGPQLHCPLCVSHLEEWSGGRDQLKSINTKSL